MFSLLATLTKQELEKIYELTYKYGWLTATERTEDQLSDRAYMEKARIEGELEPLIDYGLWELEEVFASYIYRVQSVPKYITKDILEGLTQIKSAMIAPLSDKIIGFQIGLTTMHQSGPMASYLLNTFGDIAVEVLDQLSSDKYVSQWNKELQQSTGIRVGASIHLISALVLLKNFV